MYRSSIILLLLSNLYAFAHDHADTTAILSDSIRSYELEEIVIAAPKTIRKADMDVYYPSKRAVEYSKNGVQLLSNLMIPTLSVNDALGSVQAAGQSVQLRINGREASIDEVKALLPETIKRVEWIDNPGLRYNGATHVLNLIVANPALGGSVMLQSRPVLNQMFGNYFADTKFNDGRSQWNAGARFKLTEDLKAHRDYMETFIYPDGKKLTRLETPESGKIDNSQGSAWISYSYMKPDTTIFYVSLKAWRNFSDKYLYNGIMSLNDDTNDIHISDSHGSVGTTPYFSTYFEQHFANKQIIALDFGASMYVGNSYSNHSERLEATGMNLNDIHTNIKDRNQAYRIEANYIKDWRNSRLTAGGSYSANRNRSTYTNLDNSTFHQSQDKLYFFGEYFHRLGRFTLRTGIGLQYTSLKFKETEQGNKSWQLRPQATVTYTPNSTHQFRLNFTSWQTSPSLHETNIVSQQVDGIQWTVGNPNLKTSTSYMLSLRYSFTLRQANGSFGIDGFSSPDAITPYLYWDNNRLITTYENSKGLQNIRFWIATQIEVIPGWFSVSGMLRYTAERQKGTEYKLYNHCWSGDASAMITHWGFTVNVQYEKANKSLFGEKISWGEERSIIDLSYHWKNWEFGSGILMPFGKYDQGTKLLSKWSQNEQHMRINMRMPYITIGYNMHWGRKRNSVNKIISNDPSVQKSSASNR